jgi:hypothetical protein
MKISAWFCKIAAIVIWLVAARAAISLDIYTLHGGTSEYRGLDTSFPDNASVIKDIAEWALLALLAILPNRWLVVSLVVFAISLMIALIPSCLILGWDTDNWMGDLFILLPIYAPLPLSLVLSFLRFRKGENVRYV